MEEGAYEREGSTKTLNRSSSNSTLVSDRFSEGVGRYQNFSSTLSRPNLELRRSGGEVGQNSCFTGLGGKIFGEVMHDENFGIGNLG